MLSRGPRIPITTGIGDSTLSRKILSKRCRRLIDASGVWRTGAIDMKPVETLINLAAQTTPTRFGWELLSLAGRVMILVEKRECRGLRDGKTWGILDGGSIGCVRVVGRV